MEKEDDFNFEFWASLAKDDPEEFERLRKKTIEHIINSSPKTMQKRMHGIQWQIDQIRQTAKNPTAACIKISSMMWDSVLGENGLVEAIEQLSSNQPATNKNTENATILSFPNEESKDSDISSK